MLYTPLHDRCAQLPDSNLLKTKFNFSSTTNFTPTALLPCYQPHFHYTSSALYQLHFAIKLTTFLVFNRRILLFMNPNRAPLLLLTN